MSTKYDPILAVLHPSDPFVEQVQAEIVPARDRHAVAITAEAEAFAGLTGAIAADTETESARITATTAVAERENQVADASRALLEQLRAALAVVPVDLLSTLTPVSPSTCP